MNDIDDVPRYRKRSSKKTPAKADHRHDFVNCVYEIPALRLDSTLGFVRDQTRLSIGTYCRVCGKIGAAFDSSWMVRDEHPYYSWVVGSKWSDKAEAEFDERTRTLPLFRIYDMFKQKFVE